MFYKVEQLTDAVKRNIKDALFEDLGSGDLSARFIADKKVEAHVLLKSECAVLCGTSWFENTFRFVDKATQVKWEKTDGLKIFQNELICVLKGSAKSILAAERVSLNFLQTLSATATETHNYMERIKEVKEKKCLILDTRKTLPGLRLAQKYAVRVGGGSNQRFGLWDSVLLKENHLISLGGFTSLIRRYGNAASAAEVEKINLDHFQIEVENMHEYSLATAFGAKQILLDNFSITDLKKAVSLNMNEAILEASGNISLLNIRDIVMTGVDRVSIGGLTKNLNAIDFTLRFKSASSRLR